MILHVDPGPIMEDQEYVNPLVVCERTVVDIL